LGLRLLQKEYFDSDKPAVKKWGMAESGHESAVFKRKKL
jgi:hypothetical protein